MITEETVGIRSCHYGGTKFIKKFLVSTKIEMDSINTSNLAQGSSVRVISKNEVFIFNEEANLWVQISSGGGGGNIEVETLNVTANGTYTAQEGKAYSPVRVNVPQTTIETLSVTANGTYTSEDGKAYSPINVNVPQTTIETLSVTENGTYTPEDGKAYSPVTVNVPQTTVEPLDVTENGMYAAEEGTAYNPVNVDVPQTTVEPLNVVINGTYTAPEGKAYSPVTVNTGLSLYNYITYGLPVVHIDYAPKPANDVYFKLDVSANYMPNAVTRALILPLYDYILHVNQSSALNVYLSEAKVSWQKFMSDVNLRTLILPKSAVQALENRNALSGTLIESGTGFVYVPDSLVESYKVASNWVSFATQIKGYSEAESYNAITVYTIGDVCVYNGKFYAYINEADVAGHTPTGETDENWFLVSEV